MTPQGILDIIAAIPEYIIYFYPGYLMIYCYYFFRARSLKESHAIVIKSLSISYFLVVLVDAVMRAIKCESELIKNILVLMIAILVSYTAYRIAESKIVLKVFDFISIKTTYYQNEIDALRNEDRTVWLVVYLNNDDVVYEGSLVDAEMEKGEDRYIVLSGYYKYKLDQLGKPQEPYIEDHEGEDEEKVVIHYEEIKRIEKRKTD